jgi:hypothetical protein
MTRTQLGASLIAALFTPAACEGGGSSEDGTTALEESTGGTGTTAGTTTSTSGGESGSGGATSADATTGPADSSGGVDGSTGGGAGSIPCDELAQFLQDFKMAHPGNGGMDWDINAWTPDMVAADPDAQALLAMCGADQRPVYPELAWEYGGGDHSWIDPGASPLLVCVYTPVAPGTEHWSFDPAVGAGGEVTADVYVVCHEQNPCNDQRGADTVMQCLGDASNIEIIVDTISLNDGIDAGYDLSEATTQVYLILENGDRVHMYTGL